jgi:alpha-D-ribose 1-methylphosphonate 5-phosphate C-P lyase
MDTAAFERINKVINNGIFIYANWPIFKRQCDLCGTSIHFQTAWDVYDHGHKMFICKDCAKTESDVRNKLVNNSKV